MSGGMAMVDGELKRLGDARLPVTDPAFTVGWSVFETMAVAGDDVSREHVHLERLEASAGSGMVPFPGRSLLAREITETAAAVGFPCRVRVTLTGGGHRVVVATALDTRRRHKPVRAVRGAHHDEPYLGGRTKHGSRLPWIVAVRRSGADEVLLVDGEGRFTEGTTSAVLAVVNGVLFAAPDDGRILPSTTLQSLLDRAADLGVEVQREGPLADGPWDGLYVASATRDIAPVVELDGSPLPGWEPIGRRLAAAWRKG